MTVQQVDDMSVLSVNGNIVFVSNYQPVPGVNIYENWKQTEQRQTGRMHPNDGTYYFFYNGRLVTKDWVKDQEIAEKQKQAKLIREQQNKVASQKFQIELKKIELQKKQEQAI
jgi:hypothetical protein